MHYIYIYVCVYIYICVCVCVHDTRISTFQSHKETTTFQALLAHPRGSVAVDLHPHEAWLLGVPRLGKVEGVRFRVWELECWESFGSKSMLPETLTHTWHQARDGFFC